MRRLGQNDSGRSKDRIRLIKMRAGWFIKANLICYNYVIFPRHQERGTNERSESIIYD